MKKIQVVAALIVFEDKILAVQRGEAKISEVAYKWEFPGGKVEEGENDEEALVREIYEELQMEIVVKEKFVVVRHQYENLALELRAYWCEAEHRELTLHEHVDFRWIHREDWAALDWAAADVPICEAMVNLS